MDIKWGDIQVGDIMPDGSEVIQIHESYIGECFKVEYKAKYSSFNRVKKKITASEDHMFLINLSKVKKSIRENIFRENEGVYIPVIEDLVLFTDKRLDEETKKEIDEAIRVGDNQLIEDIKIREDISILVNTREVIKSEPKIYNRDMNLIWLTALEINGLHKNGCRLFSSTSEITNIEYVGTEEVRCISTNTGRYTTDRLSDNSGDFNLDGYDMISHNSVTVRSVIFHCVTHGIKLGLVDLKLTEFSPWKGHENILGVANTVRETAELLRIARALMYKRNAELAKAGVVDLSEYKPTKTTDKVSIFGREYQENEIVTIRDPENEEGDKEITIKELLSILNE